MKRIEKKAERFLIQSIITLSALLSVPVVILLMWMGFVSIKFTITWVGLILILYIIDNR
jgi:hypothetical protein